MLLQRIGLIGDVHAQAENLDRALRFLREADVERVLCTGDIADGPSHNPADLDDCVRLLQENEVATVRGNHDRWLLSNQMRGLPDATPMATLSESSLTFLSGLPSTLIFGSHAGKLLLCHGMGENDMQGVKPDDDDHALQWKPELHQLIARREYCFVVAGHTHARMVRHFERIRGALVVINAGTLHPGFSPCFAIADFEENQVQFFGLKNKTVSRGEVLSL